MRYHISHLSASCFSALRQIRSIRRSLSTFALDMLISSLVHSRLDYCNVVLTGLPSRDIQRLQLILNSAVRLSAGSRKFDHVTPLLRDRHWLPMVERIDYKLCVLVYRCLHGTAPSYLAEFIKPISTVGRRSGLRSAETLSVAVPRTKSSVGDRAFAAAGPRAWNSLPVHVRSAGTLDSFRRLLKTHLFKRAYL